MLYALVKDGVILRQEDFTEKPPVLSGNKGKWLKVISTERPGIDSATQTLERSININPTTVTITSSPSDRSITECKDNKKKQVIAEAKSRVGELPALKDFNVYDAARAAISVIEGLTTIAEIRSYNVKTGPLWPEG